MPRSVRTVSEAYRHRGLECLCGNLRMASRALTTLYDTHLGERGLTVNQLSVLWSVIALGRATMGRIAEAVVMDKTTVTRSIAGLQAMGLVRLARGVDGRQRVVSPTARGERIFCGAMPAWEAAQREAARAIGQMRFDTLVVQARRVARVARAASAGTRQ